MLAALPATMHAAERGGTAHLSSKSFAPAPNGAQGLCSRYAWACARGHSAALNPGEVRLAEQINRRINASVRPIEDIKQYQREEFWTLPTARGGDCEDIALLKKAELIRQGLPPSRLLLATVLDRKRNNHAVLVLRTDKGDFVLDNLTDRMLHWSRTGYSFLKVQDPRAPHRWTAVLAGGIFKG
ncbi:transglutaminase-like cysteine peptidase [Rhodovulum marinum]|nr:transglutaminase-like cysteine peptidase [Rhodovulum marinum]